MKKIRKSGQIVVVTILVVIGALLSVTPAAAESTSSHEYQVKAACRNYR